VKNEGNLSDDDFFLYNFEYLTTKNSLVIGGGAGDGATVEFFFRPDGSLINHLAAPYKMPEHFR